MLLTCCQKVMVGVRRRWRVMSERACSRMTFPQLVAARVPRRFWKNCKTLHICSIRFCQDGWEADSHGQAALISRPISDRKQ